MCEKFNNIATQIQLLMYVELNKKSRDYRQTFNITMVSWEELE